jgi:DNA-binding NarL/FixJ family response regulator
MQSRETTVRDPSATDAPACVVAVDDSAEFRSALRQLLDRSSGLVLLAEVASGEAAVLAVRELEPDLVLMDVRMPGLGGIAATRAIKETRPETVVFLLTSCDPETLSAGGESPADAVVSKGALCNGRLEAIWARHGTRRQRPRDLGQRAD